MAGEWEGRGWRGWKLQAARPRERGAAWQGPGQSQAERRSPWEAAHPGEVGVCSRVPGRGSVTWLQETEGTFSGLTYGRRWGDNAHGTGHEAGVQRHPSCSPSALAAPSGRRPGWGRWGVPGLGRAWAEPGMLPPRLGRSLPPPRVLPCPGAPELRLCPHPRSLGPRAIARPP